MTIHVSTKPDDCFHNWFLGVQLVQRWQDLWAWEHALNQLPQVKTVIEIGTLYGGLSLYLSLYALQHGQMFRSIDHTEGATATLQTPLAKLIGLQDCMLQGDIWEANGGGGLLRDMFDNPDNHPLLLLCDNGNKPLEMQTFVPMLQDGDFVAVHDWGNEINPPDLDSVKHLLAPVFWQACEDSGGMTRFWRITR